MSTLLLLALLVLPADSPNPGQHFVSDGESLVPDAAVITNVPRPIPMTCDPPGTYHPKTVYFVYNPLPGCDPPDPYVNCGYYGYDPPTTCCNGYDIVLDPEQPGICYYCRYESYVCR